jgi:hypothetical protein
MTTVPVLVESQNGTFTASVLGNPGVKATGPTKDAAAEALRAILWQRAAAGDLVFLPMPAVPFPPRPPLSPEDVEDMREMCAEIYRERDEQKRREFSE